MDLIGSNRIVVFVDCGIVLRSFLVRRVIGRIYSANWGDIVLELKRSREVEVFFYVSGKGRMMVVRTEGMLTCVGRIVSGSGPWIVFVEGTLCKKVS